MADIVTTWPRTLLGPLTTIWTPPDSCSFVIASCRTCTLGWVGQTCDTGINGGNVADNTECWPPRSNPQTTRTNGALYGWGFYSPGLVCPSGYATACKATA